MSAADLILRAKDMLWHETPIVGDCGRLCKKRCCRGDESQGMRLLPGEYEASVLADFGQIYGDIFVCSGECDRRRRPYACMVFPLFPFIMERNDLLYVRAIPDLRGRRICPLYAEKLNPSFCTAIRRSARILCEDAQIKNHLLQESDHMLDGMRLNSLLNEF